MKRKYLNNMLQWKEQRNAKPLLITGTRGVGKTYFVTDFVKTYCKHSVYMNFEHNPKLRYLFFDSNIEMVLQRIQLYFQISELEFELIFIFDEITFCKEAMQFIEQKPNISIICISSFEGLFLKQQRKEYEIMTVYPLDFGEFLIACGNEWYLDIIKEHYERKRKIPVIIHKELSLLFEEYLLVGGMPCAINEYLQTESLTNVSEQHEYLIERYYADASKLLLEGDYLKVKHIYETIEIQLLKENKKFQYCYVRKGATKAMYTVAMNYIREMHLGNFCSQYNANSYKLYPMDVGLLVSKANKVLSHLSSKEKLKFRKAILETYVAQTLKSNQHSLVFWESKGQAKIDFLLVEKEEYIPIELQLKQIHSKSLSRIKQQISISYSMKLSQSNFEMINEIYTIPFYAAFCII